MRVLEAVSGTYRGCTVFVKSDLKEKCLISVQFGVQCIVAGRYGSWLALCVGRTHSHLMGQEAEKGGSLHGSLVYCCSGFLLCFSFSGNPMGWCCPQQVFPLN